MEYIELTTEPTRIVHPDETDKDWYIRVEETSDSDVMLMDERAPAHEGRGRRIKPGDRTEIRGLSSELWAWGVDGSASIEVVDSHFRLDPMNPTVQETGGMDVRQTYAHGDTWATSSSTTNTITPSEDYIFEVTVLEPCGLYFNATTAGGNNLSFKLPNREIVIDSWMLQDFEITDDDATGDSTRGFYTEGGAKL